MNDYLNENDFFKTTDMPLAGSLYYANFPLEAVDRTNSPRAEFVFKRDSEVDDVVQAHWTNQLKVEPKRYAACLKEIKARLHND
jgi:hypothetical protein